MLALLPLLLAAPVALTLTVLQEDDANIVWDPAAAWTLSPDVRHLGGATMKTATVGASARVRFAGTSIAIALTTGNGGGVMALEVDGARARRKHTAVH
jgi:hypothetical protein